MPEKLSATGISMFAECPNAYRLKYLYGFEMPSTEDMEFGKYVGEQIVKPILKDEKLRDYWNALHGYLAETNDEIIETERHFEIEINGQVYHGYFDFVTRNNVVGEIKITGSPLFYLAKMSYQIQLYNIAARDEYKVNYILMEKDKDNSFKKMITSLQFMTDLGAYASIEHIQKITEQINSCEKDDVFPPSYSNCHRCGFKQHCSYYYGF